MARSRNLKPGFFTNELLGTGDPLAQLLYAGLWMLADCAGTLEDRPARIKAEVFPHRPADVDALLDQLQAQGFLVRYQAQGWDLIHLPKFKDHQKPHWSEKPKGLPLPEVGSTRSAPERAPPSSLIPSSLIPDSLVGSELPEAGSSEPPEPRPCSCAADRRPGDALARDSAVLVFPIVGGGKGPAEWPLPEAKLREYRETFPALDVLAHLRLALQWCRDNPTKRKTARGMPAFLTRWLAREQNRGNVVPVKPDANPQARKERVAKERAEQEAERRRVEAEAPQVRQLLEQARRQGLFSRNGPQGRKDA